MTKTGISKVNCFFIIISICFVNFSVSPFSLEENCMGFMIILGKDERSKFEADRGNYSKKVQEIYDEAQTYHDGKWIMFEPVDTSMFDDFMKLLYIKRKPNRK